MSEYPKRPSHFAHKFCRLMMKSTLANELGADTCYLLTVIAHTEDAKGYRGAVLFHNGQLMSFCGFGSEDKLARCRKKAVAAGWLHYKPGARGVAARYWVVVPDAYRGRDDLPSDERPDKYEAGKPGEPESQYPTGAGESAENPRSMCGGNRGESAVNVRDSSSLHPHLHLHQDPLPPAEPGAARAEPADEPNPWAAKLGDLVAAWVAAGLPGHDAPRGIQQTSGRRGLWQMRVQDPQWRVDWRAAVERAGRSARCRGDAGEWRLQLDTFLRHEDVVTRILEGEFDDGPGRDGADRRGGGEDPGAGRHAGVDDTGLVPPVAAGGGDPGGPARSAKELLFGPRGPG